MTRVRWAWVGVCLLGGCASAPGVEEVGDVAVDPGATAVAIVPGPGGSTLVTVANGPRGVLDVWALGSSQGPWAPFGSTFAGSSPSAVVPGRVGGVDVLFVLATNEVVMSEVDPNDPGRLAFPVPILRHEGHVSIAAADLDGDGDDELVAGGPGGIQVVGELAKAIGVVPSRVPALDRRTLQGRSRTVAVAACDGAAEVASTPADEPLVRIDALIDGEPLGAPEDVTLPAVAAGLVSTGDGAYVARLDDGRLVDVSGTGAPFATDVARVVSVEGGVIAARLDGSVVRGDAGGLTELAVRFDEVPLLAAGEGILAALQPRAGRLRLFRLP